MKIISMLSACAFIAVSACGPEEVAPAPVPAPTCQKLKGTYATTFKVTSVANDPTLCEGFTEGGVVQGKAIFDSNGNLRQEGYLCTTTYTANNCNVQADCVAAGEGWSSRYTIMLKPSASGDEFSGTAEINNTGFICPHFAGAITGLR